VVMGPGVRRDDEEVRLAGTTKPSSPLPAALRSTA
jgi:hypothetical protein